MLPVLLARLLLGRRHVSSDHCAPRLHAVQVGELGLETHELRLGRVHLPADVLVHRQHHLHVLVVAELGEEVLHIDTVAANNLEIGAFYIHRYLHLESVRRRHGRRSVLRETPRELLSGVGEYHLVVVLVHDRLLRVGGGAGAGGQRVELDEVGDVDGVLLRRPEEDADAGLKLAPAGLGHLEGRGVDLSHGDGEAGVQVEDHLLHDEREVLEVRAAHEQRPLVRREVVAALPVQQRIGLLKEEEGKDSCTCTACTVGGQ